MKEVGNKTVRFRQVKQRACAVCALVAATLANAGCSARRPLEAWRKDVTRFVVVEGNGDPSCLRDTVDLKSRRGPRSALLTISSIEAAETRSRDASGVLVGQCTVNDRPWYVFLVAVIDHQGRERSEIETVRPLALTADAKGIHWFTPRDSDKNAMRYLGFAQRQKASLATQYAVFPGPQDVFDMRVTGPNVLVTEKNSGASWSLQIPYSLRKTSTGEACDSSITAEASRRTESGPD